MFKWLLPLLLLPSLALAQNPQCPTRSAGDSSNACASTAFIGQGKLSYNVAAGYLWQRPASVSATSTPIPYGAAVVQSTFTNQGTYIDEIMDFGWNVGPDGNPAVVGQPLVAQSMEYKFFNSVFGAENHLILVDINGNQHRPWSFFMPHDWTNAGINASGGFTLSFFNFFDETGTQAVKFDMHGKQGFFFNSFTWQIDNNNYAAFTQHNAARNAFLPLPFIDNNNQLSVQEPLFLVAGTSSLVNATAFIEAVSPSGSAIVSAALAGTAPANIAAYLASVSVSGQMFGLDAFNNNSSGDTIVRVAKNSGQTGNAYFANSVFGVLDWSFGVAPSDSSAWKLFKGLGFGGSQVIRIDPTTLQVAFGSTTGVTGTIAFNGVTSGKTVLSGTATGGHLSYAGSGTAPTLTAGCNGAGSSISGTDISGTVGNQTAVATTCTVTFGTAFATTPACIVSGRQTPVTSYTPGTGTLVINFASTANAVFDWACYGA